MRGENCERVYAVKFANKCTRYVENSHALFGGGVKKICVLIAVTHSHHLNKFRISTIYPMNIFVQ